jgi:hypothetical protein
MGKAVLFILVAMLSGALVYSIIAPRLLGSPNAPVAAQTTAAPSRAPVASAPPTPAPDAPPAESNHDPIPAPRTDAQKERESLEERRGVLYGRIRSEFSEYLTAYQPAPDDAAILELYASQSDLRLVDYLFQHIVVPDAYRFGFRKARLFLPNLTGIGQRFEHAAEATADESGRWQLTYK